MAIDQPREDGQAGSIDRLGVTRHLHRRAPAGMRDPSMFDDDYRFPRRLPGGRVEETVSVDSPDHGPMLVLFG
jgi:hypothetical protein